MGRRVFRAGWVPPASAWDQKTQPGVEALGRFQIVNGNYDVV
jgi:hypothetical protein